MPKKYDFSGWATKANMRCSDGRTILKDAFKDCDGKKVPLLWNHQHNDPSEVLGHAILENREDGVYAYASFNDTENGQLAKAILKHGDIESLSIWANGLKQRGGNVVHGVIREVSLVLAGANPGAFIDSVMAHSDEFGYRYAEDDNLVDEAAIYSGEDIEIYHSDCSKKIEEEEEDEKAKEDAEAAEIEQDEKEAEDVAEMEGKSDEDDDDEDEKKKKSKSKEGSNKKMIDEEIMHADGGDDDKTVEEVFNSMTEDQKTVVYAMVGQALEDAGVLDDDDDEEGDEEMKHNIFEEDYEQEDTFLCHSDRMAILEAAKRDRRSLKETINDFYGDEEVLAHSTPTDGMETPTGHLTYGFNDPSMLFPDYRSLNNTPEWISRDQTWVTKVMSAVHKSPFSRIKSVFADITAEDARAKGYVTGSQKIDEVFSTLKRKTDPTTIYKKQKMDRDNIIDITDFDVVNWIKAEMRVMLNEEIARAILIGDGRSNVSADKINPQNIRPIASDVDLFNVKVPVTIDGNYNNVIKAVIRARKNYKGSGTPTFFTTEDVLTEMLLLEDKMGQPLFKTEAELATKLRVKDIVTVEVMENQTVEIEGADKALLGVIVNLADYNVGTDKGGEINYFDDFDIDYNQEKYLIETRMSGALVKPFSAMTVYSADGNLNP
jgi:HK97 family phage prohead protease